MAENITATDGLLTEMKFKLEENEWTKVQEMGYKTGYVDGITMGNESKVQRGFDRGYENGFENSYTVSIVRGLLAVNDIQLKQIDSPLVSRSSRVKSSLSEFEKKCNDLKMTCLQSTTKKPETEPDVATNARNLNVVAKKEENGCRNENAFGDFNLSNNQLNEVIEDLKELKREILCFARECGQPQLLDQLTRVLQHWGVQHLSRHPSGQTELSGDPQPRGSDSLPPPQL